MRKLLFASFVLVPVAACSDPTTIQQDRPLAVATSGDIIVATAAMETESSGFGCGGGDVDYGGSALFVSEDRGTSFQRIVPPDARPLTFVAARDGVFYAIAHENLGAFGVVSSADGRTWTEVARGTRSAADLAVTTDGIVVAHGGGVLESIDGIQWVDRPLTDAELYQPRVARAGATTVVGHAAGGTLELSTEGGSWRERTIPGFTMIGQLIAVGDQLLASGYRDDGPAIARVDLANVESAADIRLASWSGAVFTPAGLLDRSGTLTTLERGGLGTPVDHVAPFTSAAVDELRVVLLRNREIAASNDGGLSFATLGELPLERTEIPNDLE